MSQPAKLVASADSLTLTGADVSARLRAGQVLGLACAALLVAMLMQLVHWLALVVALVVSALLVVGLSFELRVVRGSSQLKRRIGPMPWRTLEFGPLPRVVVWRTREGDDLLIARTGDGPIDPYTDGTLWLGARDDAGLDSFAARANAEIARVSGV